MRCNIPMPDLPQRLDATICTYKGKAVFVRAEHDTSIVHLYRVDNIDYRIGKIASDDPDFDIATPPLGYMQYHPQRVVYLTRRPHRRFKQGITPDSIDHDYIGPKTYGWDCYTKSFADMVEKNYPLMSNILEYFRTLETYEERAISNDCALVNMDSNIIKVYFRNEEVGVINKSGMVIPPIVHTPTTRKEWIIQRYLRDFDFVTIDNSQPEPTQKKRSK